MGCVLVSTLRSERLSRTFVDPLLSRISIVPHFFIGCRPLLLLLPPLMSPLVLVAIPAAYVPTVLPPLLPLLYMPAGRCAFLYVRWMISFFQENNENVFVALDLAPPSAKRIRDLDVSCLCQSFLSSVAREGKE